jgi:hypothetical protein
LPKIFIAFSAPPPETELVTIEIRTTGKILLDKVYIKNHVICLKAQQSNYLL